MEKKTCIRTKVLDRLNYLTNEQYIEASKTIEIQLINSSYWKDAKVIAITVSKKTEVDTYGIIQKGWDQKKTMVVPRADFKTKKMTFYKLTSFSQLEEQRYGLMEPKQTLCQKISNHDIHLVVVPGVAFDINGNRLGYGGGFYDRFLATSHAKTIALAFDCQIINEVPMESHDKKLDQIISENGFLL